MPWRHTPLWISIGGFWLTFNAGFINATGFLGLQQHGLTHVTGQATRVSIEIAQADGIGAWTAALLVIWFFLGAILSGLLIRRSELAARGRPYGIAMLVESALLTLACWLLTHGHEWASNLVAAAAGLQNAMATSYSGAVVRTTHLTGIVTDLGITIGHALRGERLEAEKLRLLVTLFLGFVLGGILGAIVAPLLGALALIPPAVSLALAAVAFIAVTRHEAHTHHRG